MFFPLGDHPNPKSTAWINNLLLAANIAVFFFVTQPLSNQSLTREERSDPQTRRILDVMWKSDPRAPELRRRFENPRDVWETRILSRNDLFTFRHGYKPGAPELSDLFTCMFLHGSLLHLFGNMLFLWIFGNNVEARLGRGGYLASYLATGAIATLSYGHFAGLSLVPLVGASGAISGVLGFYLVWFPHNRVLTILFFYLIYVPAWLVLGAYLVVDNLIPVLVGAQGNVAYGAHIGGFVAGAAAAVGFNVLFGKRPAPKPREPVWRGPVTRANAGRPRLTAAQEFVRAMEDGRMEDADYLFARVLREGGKPPHPDAVYDLGRWLYDNGFFKNAAIVFRYYIRNFPRGAELARANLGLGIILSRFRGQRTAAREYLLNAIDLAGEESAVTETARRELARLGG